MKTTKQIKTAFEKLSWVFDSETTNYAEQLFERCKEEEKGHRKFGPDFARYHTPDTINIADAARLFAVKRVAEYMLCSAAKYPKGMDYLHMQKSCFIAAGLAQEYGMRITAAWKDESLTELAELNYTDYVKVADTVPELSAV